MLLRDKWPKCLGEKIQFSWFIHKCRLNILKGAIWSKSNDFISAQGRCGAFLAKLHHTGPDLIDPNVAHSAPGPIIANFWCKQLRTTQSHRKLQNLWIGHKSPCNRRTTSKSDNLVSGADLAGHSVTWLGHSHVQVTTEAVCKKLEVWKTW